MIDLTSRQRDVLRGIADRKTSKQIARDLGLSPRTVDAHTAMIFARLRVNDRQEAVRVATELGALLTAAIT